MNEQNLKLILGLKLRQFRSERGMSLQEVANKAGVSVSYLNEIEKGKKYPKGDKLIAIAQALGVEYDALVSMKLDDSLSSLDDLLTSNLLEKLPLSLFGLDSTDVMSLMSDTPDKFGSLISTLIGFARMYDLKLEQFYFTAMRSYQENHNNYFEHLEEEAESVKARFFPDLIMNYDINDFITILENEYGYNIDSSTISKNKSVSGYRTVFIPKSKTVLLNSSLSPFQQRFALAKELGYAWLEIQERALTSSWLKIESFDHVFNNFRASYLAGALLMPRKEMLSNTRLVFKNKAWEPLQILQLLNRFKVTPEMLFYRWTELLPTFLGLHYIYFLRFFNDDDDEHFKLTKEMHFSKRHSPHKVELDEHYCRRWVTLKALQDIKKMKLEDAFSGNLIRAQRSSFWNTPNEYLNISVARPLSLKKDTNSCVTIGFLLTQESKSLIRFWNDAALQVKEVGQTCERCGIMDCNLRSAQPKILEKEKWYEKSESSLKELIQNYNIDHI